MSEIGKGARFDFAILAIGFAEENGGWGVAVGPNVLRFLYVPLPVSSAADDVCWLLKAKQCGEDLKLSSTGL